MSGVSITGVLTLVGLVVPGPVIMWVMSRRKDPSLQSKGTMITDGTVREEATTSGYLMGLLGYAIGIGNLWRFPYLVGKNGGAIFVFAYLSCLFLVAAPLFLAELAVGHQVRKSCLGFWNAVHPRWVGLGIAQVMVVFFVSTFFNVLIAYAAVYVGASMLTPLPWKDRAESFWEETVLNKNKSLEFDSLGAIQWHLVGALFVVYVGNYCSIAFGKEVLEKVTAVTVIGPVVLLFILLFQAVRLPNAMDGLDFYILKLPEGDELLEKLSDPSLWATACSQILFSLSPGFGTAITMSSFTPRRTDVAKTCVIVSLCNSAFSLLGGVAIFSILGNLAEREGVPVKELASRSGPGLAFIIIADGMDTFGWATNIMSVLFFLMLMVLGLDSSFAWIGTIVDVVQDTLLERGRPTPKSTVTAGVCTLLFLCGIPYCTRSGNQLLDVIDRFVAIHFLLLSCFIEAFILFSPLVVGYTFDRLAAGIKAGRGGVDMPGLCFLKFTLQVTAPVAPTLLFVWNVFGDIMNPYGPTLTTDYPGWLLAIGWSSFAMCQTVLVSTLLRKGEADLPDEWPEDEGDDSEPAERMQAPKGGLGTELTS